MRQSDLAYGLAAVAVLGVVAVRVWPINLGGAHVPPAQAALQSPGPEMTGMVFFPTVRELEPAPAGGWLATVTMEGSAAEILAALDARALSEPEAMRLRGGPGEGRITWLVRSPLMGYPDFITADVRNFPLVEGEAQVAIWSRPALPVLPDQGRNEARLRDWLSALGRPQPAS